MEIDKKKLAGLASLPEEQFASLVAAVVRAAGGSRMQVMAATAKAPKIRERLLAADEKEIKEIADSVDPAVLGEIMSLIGRGGKNGG